MVVLSFVTSLALFAGIGILSSLRKRNNTEDYYLAGRSVHPWLTGISAIATSCSGFMFIGQIGATYTMGISAGWLLVGWIAGDYLTWSRVHGKLRILSERRDSETFPHFLGSFFEGGGRPVTVVAALLTVAFLGAYAAAQLNAGSKALYTLFDWPYEVGALLGAAIVLLYSFSGGIRASIWTDAAQAVLMMGAMVLLLVVALWQIGGFEALWSQLGAIDPALTTLFPANLPLGAGMFIVGWLFAGIGTVGQPHIMVRFMALDDPNNLSRARRVYFTFYILFALATTGVGLAARLLVPSASAFDPELALPMLSTSLLPEVLVGLVLAGLFAATMSTADSQVLSCSAALTQDLFPSWSRSYKMSKLGTALVTLLALPIALFGSKSVFVLVTLSWSALGASLGPLLILQLLGARISERAAVAMMSAGFSMVLLWRFGFGFSGALNEMLPGMAASIGALLLVRLLGEPEPASAIAD